MPSRSSMTLSTRCAGPNAKSTTSWRALAISGSAIRSTCPTDSEPHSKTSRYAMTARAYRIRLAFQELYDQPTPDAATVFLKKWYFWATHSRLPPIIDAARTVKRHWNGILRWFHSRIANGLIEGINSLVQAAKAKARGYRSVRNLKAMVYLLAAKLNLMLPN